MSPPARALLRLTLPAVLAGLAPGIARADCIDDAAAHHGVNAAVLRAIGWHESRLNPTARGRNTDGSVDLGAFQINSVHLPALAPWGIDATALADGCINAEVAAWHYRRQVAAYGNTWAAVGAYHSHTPARAAWYADRIASVLISWHVLPPGPLPYGAPTPATSGATGTEGSTVATVATAASILPLSSAPGAAHRPRGSGARAPLDSGSPRR